MNERPSRRPSVRRQVNPQSVRVQRTAGEQQRQNRRNNFIVQGSLLAIASIIVRIIGMVYRVPLTAIIGDEGNGYYTSAFSIYTLLLILSSFSMPTAVSKIVSANLVNRQYRNAASILFHRGETANVLYQSEEYGYAFGAAGGAIGTGAGALTALLFFVILFLSQVPAMRRDMREDTSEVDSYASIGFLLLGTMLPILISSTVYNISSVMDDAIFGNVMAKLGRGDEIVTQWGIFGEYHILFNIPVALANALSSSLIPSLTRAVAEHNRRDTVSRVRYSIRFTMLIAIPSTVGLCALADPICRMLFPGKHVAMLIMLTRIGSLAVAFYSLSTISNAILQGLGHLNVPLVNALISLVFHVVCLLLLMMTGMGVYAVVISNILFAFMMCFLNQLAIRKHVRFRQGVAKTYVMPAIASVVMGIVAFAISTGVRMVLPEAEKYSRIGSVLMVVPAVIVAIVLYFGMLLAMHAFTREDLDHMPMGGRLKRFVS